MDAPTDKELSVLPRWALGAYAVRTARRTLNLVCALSGLPADLAKDLELDDTILSIERYIEEPSNTLDDPQQPDLQQYGVSDELEAAVIDVYACAYTLAEELSYGLDPSHPTTVAEMVKDCIRLRNSERVRAGVRRDYELLVAESQERHWTDETPIPRDFFALRSSFDPSVVFSGRSVLAISADVGRQLIDYFAQHPEELHQLQPRQFEELLAELFDRVGFDVRLTAQTRDQGFDVFAVHRRSGGHRFLIEAKRYAPERKISVGLVRQLHGATQDWRRVMGEFDSSVKGLIITTSWFTRDASEYLQRNQLDLDGADYERLVRWLHRWQNFDLRVG